MSPNTTPNAPSVSPAKPDVRILRLPGLSRTVGRSSVRARSTRESAPRALKREPKPTIRHRCYGFVIPATIDFDAQPSAWPSRWAHLCAERTYLPHSQSWDEALGCRSGRADLGTVHS